jgi:hypothetical protein
MLTLPTDSDVRKNYPLLRGLFNYFPAALARIANLSMRANEKHNKGEPMHHARGKSTDHGDCILRHTMDAEDLKAKIERDTADGSQYAVNSPIIEAYLEELTQRAWRANAELQEACEKYGGSPLAPGAKL